MDKEMDKIQDETDEMIDEMLPYEPALEMREETEIEEPVEASTGEVDRDVSKALEFLDALLGGENE